MPRNGLPILAQIVYTASTYPLAVHDHDTGERMAKTLPEHSTAEPNQESERKKRGQLEAMVRNNVLSALGKPVGKHRVQVTSVWDDNYRVNVFVGQDISSFTIAHSYFLRADGNGQILTCWPPIAKTY
jgi:hypothetical protein